MPIDGKLVHSINISIFFVRSRRLNCQLLRSVNPTTVTIHANRLIINESHNQLQRCFSFQSFKSTRTDRLQTSNC
jgi:hypothetical protein